MKLHYIPLYILLLIIGPKVFAQYSRFSLNWNTNAYDKLTYSNSSNETMPFRLLKPNNYNPNIKYPLVIMLHGQGEGIGESCTNQRGVNVCNLGWGGKMHLDSLNKYPAFYLFPQTTSGFWAASFSSGDYPATPNRPIRLVTEIISQLLSTYSIDANRIYGHGLCAGGLGIWELASRYPNLFAAISPQQSAGNYKTPEKYLNTAIWGIQGEADGDPSLSYGLQLFKAIESKGKPVVYTLNPSTRRQNWQAPLTARDYPVFTVIPNGGHESWPNQYNSPTWLKWMFSQNKLNITVYGNTNLSPGQSVKLEIAAGFDAYEWSTGATTRSITVSQAGSYMVRVKRKANVFSGASNFTDWSPAVIITSSSGGGDQTPPSIPLNLISTGKTTTTVGLSWSPSTDNVAVTGYEVFVNGILNAPTSTTSLTVGSLNPGTAYSFTVRARDAAGNFSGQSTPLSVTTNTSGGGGGSTGVNYAYYEGAFSVIPNFNLLSPVKTGTVPNFTLTPKNATDKYAFKFTSYVQINSAGSYTFYVNSNDGSRLYIDGTQLINNDGYHVARELSGSVTLSTGKHAIEVDYFQNGGAEVLDVSYAGPGTAKQAIPDAQLFLTNSSLKMAHNLNENEYVEENNFKTESEKTSLSAFPNPFENQLSVTINAGNEGLLKVYNSLGEAIIQEYVGLGEHHFDLSNLPKGFYYLKIYGQNGNTIQTLRVVKN